MVHQAIYRFAGADVSLMTDFANHFGEAGILYLTQTFRCHPAITETGTRFIQRNPGQLPKAVTSASTGTVKAVRIVTSSSPEDSVAQIEATLERLNALSGERRETASVLFLGRYRRALPSQFDEWSARFGHLSFRYLTTHRAKGLEADAVFVLGMERGRLAFPSVIEDDPLLQAVLPKPEAYPFAEERRLFYVALTRARRVVFVVTRAHMESSFVRELRNKEFAAFVFDSAIPSPSERKTLPIT